MCNLNEKIQEEFGFGPDVLREVPAWELIEVYDTRQLDDSWKPISGTGEAVKCECCGRFIEVHATVRHKLTSDSRIVGTQCCKKADLQMFGSGFMIAATNKNYWKRNMKRVSK